MASKTAGAFLAGVAALAMVLNLAGVAHGDDLAAEKRRVDAQAAQAQDAVKDSKAELSKAGASLETAQVQLADARSKQAAAQLAWDNAQRIEMAANEELEAANAALEAAKAEVLRVLEAITVQKAAINSYARSIVQDSIPLVGVAALINTSSTATLANRVQWNDTVLAVNQVNLDLLRDLQIQLQDARTKAEAAQMKADQVHDKAVEKEKAAGQAQVVAAQAAASVAAALEIERAAYQAAAKELRSDKAKLAKAKRQQVAVNAKIAEAERKAEQARKAAELARIAAEQARKAAEKAAKEAASSNQAPSASVSPQGNSNKLAAIASKAEALAWPRSKNVRDDDGTPATAAYRAELERFKAKPCVNRWRPDGRVCALFVSIVMWSSGVDSSFGSGVNPCFVDELADYMEDHPGKYKKLSYSSTSGLRPGDLLVPRNYSHIVVYLGSSRIADASFDYGQPGYGGRTAAVQPLYPTSGYAYRYIG